MSQTKGGKSNEKDKKKTQEQIVAGFNQLRQDQKSLISKLTDLEGELTEHRLVIDALNKVDDSRKCYRMIGGVLIEKTVKEVRPSVISNREKLQEVVKALNQQIESKGKEINEYKEKYDIQIRREPSGVVPPSTPAAADESSSSSGILVDSKS